MRSSATHRARFDPSTRSLGLSRGDRVCLALAARLGATALTADRALRQVETEVCVELLRSR